MHTPDPEPLRVLLVVDFYAPFIGGMERYVHTLAQHLVRRRHHVAVVTIRQGSAPAVAIEDGVRVYRIRGLQHALPIRYQGERQFPAPVPDPGSVHAMSRIIARERPQIINAQGWLLFPLLAANRRGARVVMSLHDYGLVCSKKTYLCAGSICSGPALGKCVRCASDQYGVARATLLTIGLRASRFLTSRVDQFVAVSDAVRRANLPGLGTPPRPIEIIPALIDDDTAKRAASVPRPAYLPAGDYFLFVGVLGAHKGVFHVLDAYRRLERPMPLVLLGTPRDQLPPLPAGVLVRQNVPHDEVLAAWYHAYAGLAPAQWADPCPVASLEALACGCPLIATDAGGLRDIVVHGETGLRIPISDVHALAAAIERLAGDRALRAAMAAASLRHARHFATSVVGVRVEQLYREVLARPAR